MAGTQLSIYTFKVGLLDLAYKNIGHPGVFEFQINNKSCLRIIVSYCVGHPYSEKNSLSI